MWLGHLLIVAAGTGLGLSASHHLNKQVSYLHGAVQLLQMLEQQVAYSAQPMAVLWQTLADSGSLSDCRLLQDTVSAMNEQGFCTAFVQAVERAEAEDLVFPAARRLLLQFGDGCGRYDVVGQVEQIAHHRRGLAALEEQWQAQVATKARLYRVLGVAGGLALALLLA